VTAYRFRVKAEWNPRGLWRDILIGGERSLEDLHRKIVTSFGLEADPSHLWFFGNDQKYWDSKVKYVSQLELEEGNIAWNETINYFTHKREERYNGGQSTISQLGLQIRDRLCYLYDYGEEWQFYMILKEIYPDKSPSTEPEVLKSRGEKISPYNHYDCDE